MVFVVDDAMHYYLLFRGRFVGRFVVGLELVGLELVGAFVVGILVVGLDVGVELGLLDGWTLGVTVSVGLMLGTTELVGTGLTVGDDVGLDVGLLVDGLVVGNNVGFAVAPTEQSVTVASFIVGLISLARFTIMFLTSAGDKVLLLARIPTAIPATSKKGNGNGQIIGWRSLVI